MEDRYSCGAPALPPGPGPPRLLATTGPVRGSAVPVERLLGFQPIAHPEVAPRLPGIAISVAVSAQPATTSETPRRSSRQTAGTVAPRTGCPAPPVHARRRS